MDAKKVIARALKAVIVVAVLGGTIPGRAATLTWNGGGTGDWDTGTSNWLDSGGGSVSWADGLSTARFASSTTATLQEAIQADGIQVNGSQSVTLQDAGGGETLTLDGDQASDIGFITNAATLTINCDLDVAGTQSWTQAGGNTLNIGGDISGTSNIGTFVSNLSLTGNNAGYNGTLSIGATNLDIGSSTPLGTGTVSINTNDLSIDLVQGPTTLSNAITFNQNNSNRVIHFLGSDALTFTNSFTRPVFGSPSQTFDVQSTADVTFSGAISGSSYSVVKDGDGRLIFGGSDTYNGATSVDGGTLLINGSLNSQTNGVTVNAGTLGGTGQIIRPVAVGAAGTLAPGASAGSIEIGSSAVARDLTLASDSTFEIEIGGTTFTFNGTEDYDRAKVWGNSTISGANLQLTVVGPFVPADGDLFGILDAVGGLTGTFAGLAEGSEVWSLGKMSLFITYAGLIDDTSVALTGGNDVVLYAVQIPEPASIVFLACGVLMIKRRRY